MHQSSQIVDEVFFALCKQIDTGISLGAWLRYKHGLFSELVGMTIDPLWYNTARDFSLDYAVVSYLAKAEFLATGIDTERVALQKFKQSEDKCSETNARIRSGLGVTPALQSRLYVIQRKISRILGPCNLSSIFGLCEWGPGSTFDISKAKTGVDVKMSRTLSTTPGALPYGRAWLESDLHWFESISGHSVSGRYSVLPSCFSLTDCNKVVVVPKNAKTGRTIASEPTWNSFAQQGVGRYLKRRLRRIGINLKSQATNQDLARHALRLGLATVDLSAASDTIAQEVVKTLLPLEWWLLLDSLRSKYYEDPDTKRRTRYEKFSSMGNAYTFELESLLFTAILLACYEEVSGRSLGVAVPFSCSVFGDDIICPSSVVPTLEETLTYLGFSFNREKSFTSGQFYESCGIHVFGGYDVTPSYQKRKLLDPLEVVRAGNRLFRLAYRLGGPYTLDRSIYGAWAAMRRHAGRTSECWIPFSERDDGWLAPVDQLPGDKYHLERGWRCQTVSRKRRFRAAKSIGVYAHTLYRCDRSRERPLEAPTLNMSSAAAGFRKEVNRATALSLDRLASVQGNGDEVELEPGKLRFSRRWVIPDVEFAASWN